MKRVFYNINFGLLILLTFLVIFSGKVEIGGISQVIGRTHLLFLHLPIGISFFLLVGLLFKFLPLENSKVLPMGMLILTSVSLVTAIGGTLLQYDGYDPAMLSTHKWAAYIFCGICIVSSEFIWRNDVGYFAAVGILFAINILSMITGHAGGIVTHGANFLLEPIRGKEEIKGEMTYYQKEIHPIFKEKCISCHNSRKQKGGLSMVTTEALIKGGENGPLWDHHDLTSSLLLQKINLPLSDEEHMPPKEKPQLTQEELLIIEDWIHSGANLDSIISVSPSFKSYSFKAADKKLIEGLNTPFLSVQPISAGSPGLEASFFVRGQYDPGSLENLLKVREQLVSLNLAFMPVGDEVFSKVSQFENIENLVLNSTDISGMGIEQLLKCSQLESLALTNTELNAASLKTLQGHESLKRIYLWNSISDEKVLGELKEIMPGVHFDLGFVEDPEEIIALNVPQIKIQENNSESKRQIEISHVLQGVTLKYTLNGNDPDSIDFQVYDQPIKVDHFIQVKALAEKEGWLPSDIVELSIFNSGIKADSSWLKEEPHRDYKGAGALGLIDGNAGDLEDFKSKGWVAWREKPMEGIFEFRNQQPKGLTVSYLVNVPSYIVHPEKIEVLGSKDGNNWYNISTKNLEPVKEGERTRVTGVNFDLGEVEPYLIRLRIHPLKQLPKWHGGAGQRGWLFLDEVYFY